MLFFKNERVSSIFVCLGGILEDIRGKREMDGRFCCCRGREGWMDLKCRNGENIFLYILEELNSCK